MVESCQNRVVNYSIIIAHKNIPDLLTRCMDSIPQRKDTQIIIVDDNSSPKIVDFNRFPGREREDIEVYLKPRSGGTGSAQNVGLEHACGKWVLFIGADDFFTEELNPFLDRMIDAKEDLIIFDHRSVLSDDVSVSVLRSQYLSKLINDFNCHSIDENAIRCSFIVATCKLIRKDLIDKHHIRFNETKWSNDNFFSAQVSCFAKRIRVCNDVIYVMTVRENSLTSDFCGTRKEAETRLQEAIKSDKLYRDYGLANKDLLTQTILNAIFKRHRYWVCLGYCLTFIPNRPVFNAMSRSLYRKTAYFFIRKVEALLNNQIPT